MIPGLKCHETVKPCRPLRSGAKKRMAFQNNSWPSFIFHGVFTVPCGSSEITIVTQADFAIRFKLLAIASVYS